MKKFILFLALIAGVTTTYASISNTENTSRLLMKIGNTYENECIYQEKIKEHNEKGELKGSYFTTIPISEESLCITDSYFAQTQIDSPFIGHDFKGTIFENLFKYFCNPKFGKCDMRGALVVFSDLKGFDLSRNNLVNTDFIKVKNMKAATWTGSTMLDDDMIKNELQNKGITTEKNLNESLKRIKLDKMSGHISDFSLIIWNFTAGEKDKFKKRWEKNHYFEKYIQYKLKLGLSLNLTDVGLYS